MKKKINIKKLFSIILIIVFSIGVVYSGYKIIVWKLSLIENKNIQEEAKKQITNEDNKYEIDFKTLKNKYKNVVGYLKVNGTNIDYVVVKGEDNSYYLNHNLKGKWNIAGSIFADYRNNFDGLDKNIVIYGHNMKDGSMFGSLKTILNDKWQNNIENRKVLFITETGTNYYEVFSTYTIKPEDYYINTDFNTTAEYTSFLKTIKSRSVYDYKVEVTKNDQVLTLSSCIGDGTKRVVLHAKLINTKEENKY